MFLKLVSQSLKKKQNKTKQKQKLVETNKIYSLKFIFLF